MKQKFQIIILLLFFSLIVSGCGINFQWTKKPVVVPKPVEEKTTEEKASGTKSVKDQLASQSQIYKFKNLEELKDFIEENVSMNSGTMMDFGRGIETFAMLSEDMAMPAVADTAMMKGMGGGSDDYSTTNIQVAGVDEADIIKTDGEYVYAVVGNDLYFIRAYPADKAEVLTKISFRSQPANIYINGNRLVVYGDDIVLYESDLSRSFRRHSPFTFFKVFDISDRKNPKQVSDLDFEGSYMNSRMVGDYVYFLTQNFSYNFVEGEPVIPRVIEDGSVLSSDCGASRFCFVPDVYYFDMPYESVNFVNIYAINVMNENEPLSGNIYLTNFANELYASASNIYLAYTKYISEYDLRMEVIRELIYPRLPKEDKDKIAKIEAVDGDILTKQEKRRKTELIIENFIMSLASTEQDELSDKINETLKQKYADISDELQKTVIHKIAYDKSKLEYIGFGEVTGRVLNQFSMDESDGYFRVATTRDRNWSQYIETDNESKNALYVLAEDMKTVGALENLAPGEQIYSVRFMQNRAYMVTFQQTDPLFVISLDDPRSPVLLGALKIPGFSNYLHPYDETTLIGLGKDTEIVNSINVNGNNRPSNGSQVKTKGIKISLFDVADVSNPKEIDSYILGDAGSDSIALSDHKAFLFSAEKNLLVIPVSLRESTGKDMWGRLNFSGAVVFQIKKDSIELRGKLDHSDGGKPAMEEWWGGYHYYDNTVKRSLYIDNVLYTFSNKYLMLNDLKSLDEIRKLEIKKEKAGSAKDFEIIN